MQCTQAMCHDSKVVAHPALVGLLCLTILVPQSLGLHWHGASGQDHEHAAGTADHATHPHPSVDLALELTPSHLQAHFADGEFDVQPDMSSPGKIPAVKFFVALLALVSLVLTMLPGQTIVWPPLRPPRPRLNARFLPPSHAPPYAA
jgi:hypothetical protein